MKKEKVLASIGLDCHRNFSTACGCDATMNVIWRRRLSHSNREALRKELGSWPQGTPVILEGTFGWGWMSDELRLAGLDPHLSSGRKVAGWRKARGMAKTNKRDATLLAELWGQSPRWWEVWCAPPEVRDLRELLRVRMSLVQIQTRLKNQIHATLHRHGLWHDLSDLFGRQGRRWLSAVVDGEDFPLREAARQTLANHLGLLDEVRRRIAVLTRQFRSTVRQDPTARRLTTLPGVSTILGYTILAEVGTIERFPSGRELSSYSLLAPICNDSGDEQEGEAVGRYVGKVGRRTLKWAWIQAAHSAIRKSPRMKDVFERYTGGGKHDRNRGFIAVGHQLCLVGYVLWKKQINYQETPPPRPGSERRRQKEAEALKKTRAPRPMRTMNIQQEKPGEDPDKNHQVDRLLSFGNGPAPNRYGRECLAKEIRQTNV